MLQVTPRAAEALRTFLQGENKTGQALRIMAQSGCCSGTMYGLFFEKEAGPDDLVINQDGVTIYMDRMSDALLSEAKLDFEMGPQGEAFFIDNPLDQQRAGSHEGGCGCGGGSCGCGGNGSTHDQSGAKGSCGCASHGH
jgi:iron-sulfur cluster assembly accessory protein